jgi:hypothetical protein
VYKTETQLTSQKKMKVSNIFKKWKEGGGGGEARDVEKRKERK